MMVNYKNQHYVPKFFFKYFSNGSDEIRVYYLKGKKHYVGAIKNQASKDYFYSENTKIEKSFGPLEGQFNIVLKKIIENTGFQVLTEKEYFEVLSFLSFQKSRTEKQKLFSEDMVQKMVEKYIKPMMKSNKKLMKKLSEEDLDKATLSHPGVFLYWVVHSLEAGILLSDLIPMIIVNETSEEFIFSDNPVISYNLIYRDPTHPFESSHNPGLIILCPLSPKKCLMLFDPKYYSINAGEGNVVHVDNHGDIRGINKLQFHNCLQNIYYCSEDQETSIDNLSQSYSSEYSREGNLANLKEVPDWNGGGNSLLVTSKKGIPEKIKLSFIECGKPLRKVDVVRNKEIYSFLDKMMAKYK